MLLESVIFFYFFILILIIIIIVRILIIIVVLTITIPRGGRFLLASGGGTPGFAGPEAGGFACSLGSLSGSEPSGTLFSRSKRGREAGLDSLWLWADGCRAGLRRNGSRWRLGEELELR
jgi:hypothetical protein